MKLRKVSAEITEENRVLKSGAIRGDRNTERRSVSGNKRL